MKNLKNLAACTFFSLAATFAAMATISAATAAVAKRVDPTAQNPFPARWNTTKRGLILVPDEAHAMTTDLAVKRLRSLSPIRYDLVDGVRDNRTDFKNYDITIILGVTGDNKELAQGWTGERPTNEDAWALKTISTDPLVIVATGNRPRAVLYAVWALADKISMGDDISNLAMQETPRVDKRYAVICGTAYGGQAFDPHINRHTLYMATLDEMPRYGINGIFLCPGQWRVAVGPDRLTPPIVVSKDGKVSIDEAKLPDWRTMIGVIKAYDMDIIITLGAMVPPTFDVKKVTQDFIIGGKEPEGYLAAVDKFFRDYMETVIKMFPDIDGYVMHAGVEGAQYSGVNQQDIRTFLEGQNLDACVKTMKVYLNIADELTRKYNKSVAFWTHQWGANTDGLDAMRNMLFQYPRFTILEEDYWPNGIWIRGSQLPIMAYLDPKMRDDVDKHNKLGILALSDAEYYGGGSLPNAIAEPYIYSMNELVKRNTGMLVFRLNLHDRTPYGSLWSTAGIQLEQSANILWQNPKPTQQVYDTWIRRTYGAAAAPLISKALANCYKIIYDGLTIDGANMLGPQSKFYTREWMPVKGKVRKFDRPNKSGVSPFKPGQVISSGDQSKWQIDGRKDVSFAQFKQASMGAADEVKKSLDLIEQARPSLANADYVYLHEIFNVAGILINAYYNMNQTAYAINLVQDNFDKVPDPKAFFQSSLKALEDCAASDGVKWISSERSYVYGDVGGELQKLIDAYRKL